MNRAAPPFCFGLVTAMLAAWSTGCGAPPIQPVLTDSDPSVKIPAIKLAVQNHDAAAIPILIKDLQSDDPAVRFYSIDALKKLTDFDFGYLYYADEDVRRPAVLRWQAWAASGGGSAANAATQR